eukprot:GHVN01021410.1.p1 GENE.GHVN01021410.1~~GHVN01021410.1.p1  ORF type:complete len:135 (+),score=58.67 GHVN01021410.1:159-563(+)
MDSNEASNVSEVNKVNEVIEKDSTPNQVSENGVSDLRGVSELTRLSEVSGVIAPPRGVVATASDGGLTEVSDVRAVSDEEGECESISSASSDRGSDQFDEDSPEVVLHRYRTSPVAIHIDTVRLKSKLAERIGE